MKQIREIRKTLPDLGRRPTAGAGGPQGSTKIHAHYSEDRVGWYGPEDWDAMNVNAEVRGWCERALFVPGVR